jgi:hypothetical protein
LWNIEATSGFTAGLDLDRTTGSGATAVLTTDLTSFSNLDAGSEQPFNVFLDTSAVGYFAAVYVMEMSNEDLPGGWGSTSLGMLVSASVYLPADVTGDGQVNGLDVEPFAAMLIDGSYGPSADMNRDDVVNGLDIDLFVAAVVGGASAGTAIPEPSTGGLLALAALTMAGCLTRVATRVGGAPRRP